MPKTGRPKSDNPKDIRFSIRIDADTNDRLEKYAEYNQITVAEAIRRAIRKLLKVK